MFFFTIGYIYKSFDNKVISNSHTLINYRQYYKVIGIIIVSNLLYLGERLLNIKDGMFVDINNVNKVIITA